MKKPVIILGIIALYSYIIPYGFITIDPCSSTPGHNNTVGYILVALFPVLLGLLLYFLFVHKNAFRLKSFLKSVALSVGWLVVALGLWAAAIQLLLEIFNEKTEAPIPYISQYGCYNNIEPTDLVYYLSWLICSIVTGLIGYRIISKHGDKLRKMLTKNNAIVFVISVVWGLSAIIHFCKIDFTDLVMYGAFSRNDTIYAIYTLVCLISMILSILRKKISWILLVIFMLWQLTQLIFYHIDETYDIVDKLQFIKEYSVEIDTTKYIFMFCLKIISTLLSHGALLWLIFLKRTRNIYNVSSHVVILTLCIAPLVIIPLVLGNLITFNF